MSRRRTAEEATRMLRDADRDLAKGPTVSDICRKQGVAETTYYRWRQRFSPEDDNFERRFRALEIEADRLKKLVAEFEFRTFRRAPRSLASDFFDHVKALSSLDFGFNRFSAGSTEKLGSMRNPGFPPTPVQTQTLR